MWPCLPHHLYITTTEPVFHVAFKLSVIAVHHVLLVLFLWFLLLLCTMTREINNWHWIVMLWKWLLDMLWRKRPILKCTIIRMRVKGQMIVLRWPNVVLTIVGSTLLVILATKLLHRNGHIFRVCLFGDLVLVHKLMIGHHWWVELIVRSNWADLLDLRYIVLHFLKVRVFELAVLIQISSLLAIA